MAVLVSYLEDLVSIDQRGSYELTRDLDFNDNSCYRSLPNKTLWTTGLGWPGAAMALNFFGKLDGKGYKIKNLYISGDSGPDPKEFRGLFKTIGTDGLDSAEISNLVIENPNINLTDNKMGFLCGHASGNSVINNVHIKNGTSSGNYLGGISYSTAENAAIKNSSFEGNMTSKNAEESTIGGIVACITGNNFIVKCAAKGSITGNPADGAIGGITGWISSALDVVIEDCYSEMSVPNTLTTGGLCGGASSGSKGTFYLTRCWTNKTSGVYPIIEDPQQKFIFIDNFYDSTTTGVNSATGGSARTTRQMKESGTFTDWKIVSKDNFDFNSPSTWYIDEDNDYPRLWWEMKKESLYSKNPVVNILMSINI